MSGTKDFTDVADYLESIPEKQRPVFTALQGLLEEVVPDADVSVKWGALAYDLDGGSMFALSANKKQVNLYILTLGLLAEFSEELAGIPQSKCVLRFSPKDEPPMETLRRVMTTAVKRKRA
ncbi:MAG: DUF1801 domain-containing protein [Gemmatimonadetes bacterium]|nr:DUF1801 domain-containing protein [Gemmatimonadota bacterium]